MTDETFEIAEMISEEELAAEKAAQEEGAEVEYDDEATSEGE